jgi:hypothetical protein
VPTSSATKMAKQNISNDMMITHSNACVLFRVKSEINLVFIEGVGMKPYTPNPGNHHLKLLVPGLFLPLRSFQTRIL